MIAPFTLPTPADVRTLLSWAEDYLDRSGVLNPRWHAELLLGALLGVRRHELYLYSDRLLEGLEADEFSQRLRRRGRGEPTQYILGRTEFYGLEFRCDDRALIPRPETEHLVDTVIEWAGGEELRVIDLGTGSGCIAVSLAVRLTRARLVATDLRGATLDLARDNAALHDVADRIEFRVSDLFATVPERFDLIVSNPPYVGTREAEQLQREIKDWEPPEALFAGPDGLAILEPLIRQAPDHLDTGGRLICEIGAGQERAVTEALARADCWESPHVVTDYQGHARVIAARKI